MNHIKNEGVWMLRHVRLFVTAWTVDCQTPVSLEFCWQKYWSGLPFPPPGELPNPGIEPVSPVSWITGRVLTTQPWLSLKPKVILLKTYLNILLLLTTVIQRYQGCLHLLSAWRNCYGLVCYSASLPRSSSCSQPLGGISSPWKSEMWQIRIPPTQPPEPVVKHLPAGHWIQYHLSNWVCKLQENPKCEVHTVTLPYLSLLGK